MQLDEFQLQPRGPYLFDHYIHPDGVDSPVGTFALELHVDDAATWQPDEKMLEALVALRTVFEEDQESIISLIHQQYLLVTEEQSPDESDSWGECVIPSGKKQVELEPLLDCRSLSVSQHEIANNEPHPGRVFMSPVWDEEHGLYFARVAGSWVRVDC